MWDDALWRLKLQAELEQTRRGPKPARRRRRKTAVTALAHQLDRTLVIGAPPAAVFKYFTDPARWAAWWGAGSTIDARPGGRVFIRYPGGIEARGEVVEITPPSQIVFTYGYVTARRSPPGESRVTIRAGAGRRAARGCSCPTSSPTRPCATNTSRAGAISSRCSPTSSPTRSTAKRRRWWTAGSCVGGARRREATRAARRHRVRRRADARSLQLHRRRRRARPPHRRGAEFMPGIRLQREGRSAPLPGHGAGRLDGRRARRSPRGQRDQRLQARRRRPDRVGHGFLG